MMRIWAGSGRGPRNVTFQKISGFWKFYASATPLSTFDEMSKFLRGVALFDAHLGRVWTGSSKCYFSKNPLACSRRIHYSATRWRPASPALAQTQPSPCSRLRLCCLVFLLSAMDKLRILASQTTSGGAVQERRPGAAATSPYPLP